MALVVPLTLREIHWHLYQFGCRGLLRHKGDDIGFMTLAVQWWTLQGGMTKKSGGSVVRDFETGGILI